MSQSWKQKGRQRGGGNRRSLSQPPRSSPAPDGDDDAEEDDDDDAHMPSLRMADSPLASRTVAAGGGSSSTPPEGPQNDFDTVLHGSVSAPGAKGVGAMSVAERVALFGGSR